MQYSIRSRRAVARLFSQYNDIDVYVEDRTYIGVYERIINKCLKGKGRITKVIALGPKSEVLRQAALDKSSGGKARIYIVDGDLDLPAFHRQKSYPHLFRLNVYSVENLLISEEAIEKYCQFTSPSMADGVCAANVRPAEFLYELELLLPYVIALAIARRLDFHHSCIALNPPSVTKTIGGRHVGPDQEKIAYRVAEIESALIDRFGEERFLQAKSAVEANIYRKKIKDHRIVPGKSFGLMYLNERVVAAGGIGLPHKAVASYLADVCDLRNDKRFLTRMKKLARARRT